jgi:hypothetical protein
LIDSQENVPARIVWTRFCNSGRLWRRISMLVIPVVFTYVDDAILRVKALLRRRHA